MISLVRLTCLFAATLVLLNLTALPALAADDQDISSTTEPILVDDNSESGDDLGEIQLTEEDAFPTKQPETHTILGGFAGYKFLSIDGFGGRAAKYDYLHSGITGGGYLNSLGPDLKLAVDGAYLNDNDYHGDMILDFAGDHRFHLRTEALFHNLTGEKLFDKEFLLGAVPYIPHQGDSLTRYGVKSEQDLANFRYKLHDFPLHINLGYWRMVKEGSNQLRYADIAFEGPQNNFFAQPRLVDRETHEGNVGFDTHLGPIDLIYNFQIRQFVNNAVQLRDDFAPRDSDNVNGVLVRNGGLQEHNEDPDSRYLAHTVKLHTSLAGGMVGAASYTYGRRDNLSKLTDTIGADQASVTLHNAAGDFVYTPFKEFSLGIKYRRQEVDNNSPAFISNKFFVQNTLAVRPSINTKKDVVVATFLLRPNNLITIKGEYKGEILQRDLPSNSDERLNWFLTETQDTHRGTLALLSRPLKGLKLSARYSYSTTDHPSYGTSFAQKHEGEILSSYNMTSRWGLTASYRSIRESNDQIERRTITVDPQTASVSYSLFSPLLSQDKSTNNVTAGLWFVPVEKLTFSANYGFFDTSVDQALMYSINGTIGASNYTSRAQFYSLNSTYRFSNKFNMSLSLQQVFSLSEFQPDSNITLNGQPTSSIGDTSGVKDISHAKTVETSFSARGDYSITKNLSCSAEYMLKDYYDKFNSLFDGTVHIVTAYVSTKW